VNFGGRRGLDMCKCARFRKSWDSPCASGVAERVRGSAGSVSDGQRTADRRVRCVLRSWRLRATSGLSWASDSGLRADVGVGCRAFMSFLYFFVAFLLWEFRWETGG
jgi:hypothetical protein